MDNQGEDFIRCVHCDNVIAEFVGDEMNPSFIECYQAGKVPVPNCGWFCSQKCANDFGIKWNVKFDRDPEGTIDYYHNDFGK